MSHWTKPCSHPTGHHIDNQGCCHSCGAEQIVDHIYIVEERADRDFIAAFSTIERAHECVKNAPDYFSLVIRRVSIDDVPILIQ